MVRLACCLCFGMVKTNLKQPCRNSCKKSISWYLGYRTFLKGTGHFQIVAINFCIFGIKRLQSFDLCHSSTDIEIEFELTLLTYKVFFTPNASYFGKFSRKKIIRTCFS